MKKILKSRLVLILSGPVMGLLGLVTLVQFDKGSGGLMLILLLAGLVLSAVNSAFHVLNDDVTIE